MAAPTNSDLVFDFANTLHDAETHYRTMAGRYGGQATAAGQALERLSAALQRAFEAADHASAELALADIPSRPAVPVMFDALGRVG